MLTLTQESELYAKKKKKKIGVQIFAIFSPLSLIKSYKKTIHLWTTLINFLDKSISLCLMNGSTGFYGFIVIL